MAFTHTIGRNWSSGGRSIEHANAYTGDAQESLSVTVPADSDDLLVAFQLDVSQIQAIYFVSDQDLTLKTNSDFAPDETINLVAGVPYVWALGDYLVNLLATDITALYLTRGSGEDALFQLEVLSDPTV